MPQKLYYPYVRLFQGLLHSWGVAQEVAWGVAWGVASGVAWGVA